MSRTPDYNVKALNKRTGDRTGKIGAGWKNEDGSISVKLDMFVTIAYDPDLLVTLFVNDRPAPDPSDTFTDPFAPATKKPRARKVKPSGMAALPVSVRHRLGDK